MSDTKVITNKSFNTTSITYGNHFTLILEEMADCYLVRCCSTDRRVRALEFMDYLFERYGIEEGNEKNAEGKISKILLGLYISESMSGSVEKFFEERIKSYFRETDIVDTLEQPVDLSEFEIYRKKIVQWAFVKTTDIVEKGKKLCIKSLENTSGTVITADENLYIMIGNRGEVYDIKKEKFDNSYYITDEKLDIFTSMMDFIPTVETMSDGCDEKQCLSIDEMAKICYPKTGINIYAKELKNRTKVFGVSNREDYYIGHQGDYMAVRTDDVSDAYIIKRDIFHITYEKSS